MLFISYISSFLIYCFLTVNPVVLQQAKTDFKKANDAFKQNAFSVNMTYNFYKQHSDIKPNESKTGLFIKSGDNSYSKIADIESIRTKGSTISIQPEDKILIIADAAKKESTLSFSPDTLLGLCSEIKRSEVVPGFLKYELIFGKALQTEFDKIDVVIDKNGFKLSKLVMYYKQQEVPSETEADKTEILTPRVEVVYKGYSKATPIDPVAFLEDHYVKLVAPKTYKGVGKYTGYKIYNQKIK